MEVSTPAAAILALASLSVAALVAKRETVQFLPFAAPGSSAIHSTVPSAALVQSTCIAQAACKPIQSQVKDSINQWRQDAAAVNEFLNVSPGLVASGDIVNLGTQASLAFMNARREPCQLKTLTSLSDLTTGPPGPPAFTCAANNLTSGFDPNVLDNLQTFFNNAAETTSVQAAVDVASMFRFCNSLGIVSIPRQDTAENRGIGDLLNVVALFEDACNSITCMSRFGAMDNGGFGKPGDLTSGELSGQRFDFGINPYSFDHIECFSRY